MAMNRTQPPLDERIPAFRAEIDQAIDRKVAEIAKDCPGVPAASIRRDITRNMGCQCEAYLQLQTKDEQAA